MKNKPKTMTVRELMNALSKFKPEQYVIAFCENDIVPVSFIVDSYEDTFINTDEGGKYTSENDFYNVVTLHLKKSSNTAEGFDIKDYWGEDDFDDDMEGEEWKK